MEITIQIDGARIAGMIEQDIVEEATKQLLAGHGLGWTYRKDVKEMIRDVIRANIDDLSQRAVDAAAKSIENRAYKRAVDELAEKVKL